ncbi:MAG: hypothetical protein ACP5FH_07640 [Terracidiphilus sp.]
MMHGLKILLGSAALLVGLALAPAARAQVSIGINIGGPPPVCPYGYFEYPPYQCAPYGYYGPGYFFNGIFLGVGPWAGWGYAHGWGRHRFIDGHGGRYHGNAGYEANHGHFVRGYDDRAYGAARGRGDGNGRGRGDGNGHGRGDGNGHGRGDGNGHGDGHGDGQR